MTTDHPVFHLADRFVDACADVSPMDATYLGVAGHDHRWGDLGPDGVAAERALLRRTRAELDQLPPPNHADEKLAVRVLVDHLDPLIEAHEHDDPLRDLAHISSTIPEMRDILEVQDTSTSEGQEALLQRLQTLPDAMSGWRTRLELGLRRGAVAARRQVVSVTTQLRAWVADDGALPQRIASLTDAAPHLAEPASACLEPLREEAEETARWLEEVYAPQAPERDAVGPDRYGRAIRGLLGTDLDVDEAYAWAWDELDGLLRRLDHVAEQIDPRAGTAAVIDRLRTDPVHAAPTPERFRELMQERQTLALRALADRHFDVPSAIRDVEVKLAPPGGALGAYYVGPTEDLSRPGSIWWSLGDRRVVPLFEEVTTAYHEGFPGHHLQVGLQVVEAQRLSRAHRMMIWNPGYGEGWALYAETLMDELGFLEEPSYVLGYLTSSILRVLRVVIDIGLHLERIIPPHAPFAPCEPWTFQRAVTALRDVAGLEADYALSETRRYLGWPGQAISYAIGQRAILQLREERRQRDAESFDLKQFHGDVLGSGPVGLDHLRELVLA